MKVGAIIWAAGYVYDYDWVHVPVIDSNADLSSNGVTEHPGLYFLGLHWMHTFRSGLFSGVGADAIHRRSHGTVRLTKAAWSEVRARKVSVAGRSRGGRLLGGVLEGCADRASTAAPVVASRAGPRMSSREARPRLAGLDHHCDDAGAVRTDTCADQVEPAARLIRFAEDVVVCHDAGVAHAVCAER
jgi:hypothetical protein